MSPTHLTRTLLLLFVVASTSCGGQDAQAGAAAGDGARVDGSASAAAADDGSRSAPDAGAPGSLELTVDGEPFAGTHRLVGETQCHVLGEMWQAMLEKEQVRGPSGVLLMFQGVPASGGSTDRVNFSVRFGAGAMDEVDLDTGLLELHGAETGGDARGTVTREGRGAVFTVQGTTHVGARISATLRCGNVDVLQ